ncbi:hypothetical protein [Ligilactobacillus araffinosus]|uniref:Uncharacterized protein n=1 Tax=Ligilactobacillus araffinosus DSM 20653 TaxID=1423820 RepID=A0A0R1ZBX4_9LACO|nr:hypothetical protein [Ligilactobacillus araffinosus]KRM52247.1 hypothetical protein FC64_GL000671 [Ligilactobacillus araffinosus DSM 20653]
MDYAKAEAKLLTKINDQIEKLDINLSKMGSAENKLIHFADQEKALHDLHNIIRDGKKIDRVEEHAEKQSEKEAQNWINDENSTVNKIERKVDDLIGTLSNVSDDDSKIKSYVEQKKVIGDIKSIIKEFDK